MKRPVVINMERVKQEIEENRMAYERTGRRIAALSILIRVVERFTATVAASPLAADSRLWWEAQIPLHEADLASLRLQQEKQNIIYTALQQLLASTVSRPTASST